MSVADTIARIRSRSPEVAVIGDFLLDEWWLGSTARIAREAPAPVVDVVEQRRAPGGAANTALNLAELGARVTAVGLLGDDDAGHRVRNDLRRAGVDVARLRTVPGSRTLTKMRVLADDQLMIRIDHGASGSWPMGALHQLARDAVAVSASGRAQLICDYGSATLTDGLIEQLAAAPRPQLRVVDAHDVVRWHALHPDLVTPNAAETMALAGAPLGEGPERIARTIDLAPQILDAAECRAAVVTLDRDGTVLLTPGAEPHRTRTHPLPERQASGAGDVFAAGMAVARASGAALPDCCDFAQAAVDVAVRTPGTCVCSLSDLEAPPVRHADRFLDADALRAVLDEHRRAGHRIVFTNGCFDVLHSGHTSYLRQAKLLGDVLVVAVNSDASARRLKGPDRPVNALTDRADLLAELACVDYVTAFDEDSPAALITELRPDLYAKGGDYTPEMLAETAAVHAVGGEVAIMDYVPDHSTTRIIGRIRTADAVVQGRADSRGADVVGVHATADRSGRR